MIYDFDLWLNGLFKVARMLMVKKPNSGETALFLQQRVVNEIVESLLKVEILLFTYRYEAP